jgi:uncharacterized membrane protein
VPLNGQLAVSPASPNAPAYWQHFTIAWTPANQARARLSLSS